MPDAGGDLKNTDEGHTCLKGERDSPIQGLFLFVRRLKWQKGRIRGYCYSGGYRQPLNPKRLKASSNFSMRKQNPEA